MSAYGKVCEECSGKNSFASVCKKKERKGKTTLHEVEVNGEGSSEEEKYYNDAVRNENEKKQAMWMKTIKVERK